VRCLIAASEASELLRGRNIWRSRDCTWACGPWALEWYCELPSGMGYLLLSPSPSPALAFQYASSLLAYSGAAARGEARPWSLRRTPHRSMAVLLPRCPRRWRLVPTCWRGGWCSSAPRPYRSSAFVKLLPRPRPWTS